MLKRASNETRASSAWIANLLRLARGRFGGRRRGLVSRGLGRLVVTRLVGSGLGGLVAGFGSRGGTLGRFFSVGLFENSQLAPFISLEAGQLYFLCPLEKGLEFPEVR